MVFNHIKETFRSRRSRHERPASAMPAFDTEDTERTERDERAEQLQETMNVFNMLGHSISSKRIRLPPLPSFKPLNLSSMGDLFKSTDDPDQDAIPAEIRRKPCPSPASNLEAFPLLNNSPRSEMYYEKLREFDPCTPVTHPFLHKRAREALKRRYLSKFTEEGDPRFDSDNVSNVCGASIRREYGFKAERGKWCNAAQLDLKVLEDIVWVRERFLQAKQEEPTDEDIIRFYDAEQFDVAARSVFSFEGSTFKGFSDIGGWS